MLNYILLLAPASTNPEAGPANNWSGLLMILAIFVVFYFFMIRPQQKKQKEIEQFRKELKKGDKIVTIGGIYGTIEEVKETTLLINVDKNVTIKVDKASVVKDFSDTQA
jgi:preprotein translocase subunit YajC